MIEEDDLIYLESDSSMLTEPDVPFAKMEITVNHRFDIGEAPYTGFMLLLVFFAIMLLVFTVIAASRY